MRGGEATERKKALLPSQRVADRFACQLRVPGWYRGEEGHGEGGKRGGGRGGRGGREERRGGMGMKAERVRGRGIGGRGGG